MSFSRFVIVWLLVPEMVQSEEMCRWMASRCPFLQSPFKLPLESSRNSSQRVSLSIKVELKRLVEIDDLRQEITLIAALKIYWQVPPCARVNQINFELFKQQNEISIQSNILPSKCFFSMETQIWYPQPLLINSVTQVDIINYNIHREHFVRIEDDFADIFLIGRYQQSCELNFRVILYFFFN